MENEYARRGQQWWIALAILIGLTGMTGVLAAASADTTAAIRVIIRATARSSLVLFLLTFCASGLARLVPGAVSGWLLANRRQIGFGFGLSHLFHAGAIIALAQHDPALFAALTSPASFIFGGSAYVVILAMMATSFDSAVRAIGLPAWTRLHRFGMWFLWLMFVVNFGKRVPAHPSYLVAIALAAIALAVRLAGRKRHGHTHRAPA